MHGQELEGGDIDGGEILDQELEGEDIDGGEKPDKEVEGEDHEGVEIEQVSNGVERPCWIRHSNLKLGQ